MEAADRNKLLVNTTLLVGKILMQSGAETERVEDTMERILRSSVPLEQADEPSTFVMLNGIFVGIDSIRSSFLQVKKRSYNITKITQVNQLSRDYIASKITLEEMYRVLKEIHNTKERSISFTMITAAVILSGFTALLFGGVLADFPAAAIAGGITYLMYALISHIVDIPFICEFTAAFLGGLTGLFCAQWIGVNPDIIMTGAVVALVPGIAITNGIRDIMQKHYITGLTRLLESLFVTASLSAGITVAFLAFSRLI